MQKANKLIERGNYTKAIGILETIIRDNPEDVCAIYKAAICYLKAGEPLKAKDKFELLLSFDSDDSEILQQYSITLFHLGEIAKSVNVLKKAVSNSPNDVLINHQLSYLYFQEKDYDNALIYVNKSINLSNLQQDNSLILELLTHKALICENLDKKESIKTYFSIIKNFDNHANSYDRVSSLVQEQFEFSKNLENLNVDDYDYHVATMFLREGNIDKSISLYKSSIKRDKYCYPAYLGISQALYEQRFGNRDIIEIDRIENIEKLFINYNFLNNTEKNIVRASVSLLDNFLDKLIANNSQFTIVPIDVKLTDYPANIHLQNKNYINNVSFCTLRGIGGDNAFVGIERVRDFLWDVNASSKFLPACISHEFGHMVWAVLDDQIIATVKELFNIDKKNNNCISLYSQSNEQEYFAEYYAYCSRLISVNEPLPVTNKMVNLIDSLRSY